MEMKKDLAVIVKLGFAVAAIYFVFKYVFVLFLPFILGFAISCILRPLVRWFHEKFRIKKGFVAAILLIVLLGSVLWLGCMLIREGTTQIKGFLSQWGYYGELISEEVEDMCCRVEDSLAIKRDTIYPMLCDNMAQLMEGTKSSVISGVMSYSVPTLMKIIEICIFLMAMVVSAFFYSTADERSMDNLLAKMPYGDRCRAMLGKMKVAVIAFLKTQVVIMLVTMVICGTGLFLLKNPYALLLGIVIGLLDAMPLIGVGVVLIPWTLVALLMKDLKLSIGLILIFLACYLAREILEPRLMGKGVGISPIMSLISIYIGYYLFGLLGVIIGPVAYLILKEVVEYEKIN
ncbi:MAG: AI-2E family transporter [Lachnospiraceae bacterium]|nr:AI-2E family transporter [Lachnospiraceae bacterium]